MNKIKRQLIRGNQSSKKKKKNHNDNYNLSDKFKTFSFFQELTSTFHKYHIIRTSTQ